jgi:hypothetical protein
MGEQKVNGRILYYDPNGVRTDGFNDSSIFNRDLTKDPEDLSIAVDLQVVTKKRGYVYSEANGTTTTWSLIGSGTKVNFLGGSNLDGGKNSNVLTDFFSNIGDKKDGVVENLPEAMCVNSIDIEFSSWYAASVIISFTDVRGAALFSSADYIDYLKDNNRPVDDGYESFYKTFFSFPYPMYKLKVKGFYGDAVTYPLHCSDFKAQFNASTGNFDVTVNFIGYTYAMLNDVQMTYLMAAPYCEYEGQAYWKSQIENGRFKSSEGNPLPTLYELLAKVKQGDYEIEKISQGNLTTGLEAKKTQLSAATSIIENDLRQYAISITNEYGGKTDTNTISVIEIPKKKNGIDNIIKDSTIAKAKEIDEKIKEYKTKYTDSNIFTEYKDVENLKFKVNGDTQSLNLKFISDAFSVEKIDLQNQINNNMTDIDLKKNETLTKSYGMTANIFNYFKVLVAHMETFYHMIESCSKNIGIDRGFGFIPVNKTDGNVQKDKNSKPILPAFPWVTKNGKFDRLEDEWIGNYDTNLEEVKFIESLIKSKTAIQGKIDELAKDSGPEPIITTQSASGLTIGDIWLPMHPFDNSINLIGGKETSPWSKVVKTDKQIIYDRLYLRSLLPTLFSGVSQEKIRTSYSICEALNIYDQIKGDINLGASIQTMIKDLDHSLKTPEIKEGTFNTSGKLITKTEKATQSSLAYFKIPFFEDHSANFKSYLTEQKINYTIKKNKNWFYDVENKYVTSGSNGDNLYKGQNRFKIVKSGYKNEFPDKIYNEYYKPLKNKINTILSGKNIDKNISSILDNYKFDNNNNEIITYDFYDDYSDTKRIINKITNKRLETTVATSGEIKDAFTAAGFTNKNDFFFKNDLNVDNLWYIYGGNPLKSDRIIKREYNKLTSSEKDDYISKLSYPFIGGYEYAYKDLFLSDAKIPFSLFGHPFYYAQTSLTGNTDDYLTSFLFLNSLNINISKIEQVILNNRGELNEYNCYNRSGYMKRIPKAGALLVGGMLWRYMNYNYNFRTFGSLIQVPKKTQYFTKDGTLSFSHHIDDYDVSSLFIKYGNEDEDNTAPVLDWAEVKFFVDLFVKFTLNEWKAIKEELELQINVGNGYRRALPNDIVDICKKIKDITKNEQDNSVINKEVLNLFYNKENGNIKNYVNMTTSIKSDILIQPEYLKHYQTLLLVNKDGTESVNKILRLLFEDCVLTYSGNIQTINLPAQSRMQETTLASINEHLALLLRNPSYASNLGLENSLTTTSDKKTIASVDYNEDLRLTTYTYIKTLYDKWVSGWLGKDGKPYKWIISEKPPVNGKIFKAIPETVGNSYIKNFRFIDRSHNDIGIDMLINYRNAISGLYDSATQKTLFSAMTDVLQQNQMLFLPMPSYQSFDDIDDLVKVFDPIPFSNSKMVSEDDDLDSAMYLCMYAGRPSSRLNLGSNSPLADDGYPLNEPTSVNANIPKDFFTSGDGKATVPAIAVNFGQQNQQYFKNFSLNMSNPNTTDASIQVLRNLNERANQNSTVEPIGQDMFSLYSQYSYTCDVEMMGCAQIQPMMYFQLANIPMWNGAYMIYKVKHSIKPGNMSTSFTGMRMAKTYPKLITQNMISFKLSDSLAGLEDSLEAVNSGDPNKMISFGVNDKFRETDYFKIIDYRNGKAGSIPENIYNRLRDFTSIMVENINSTWEEYVNGEYKLGISDGYRLKSETPEGGSPTSAHYMALAVDLFIINQNNNKELTKKLYEIVIEKMVGGMKAEEVLFEKNKFYWIHVAFGNGSAEIKNKHYVTKGEYAEYEYHKLKVGTKFRVIPQAIWPEKDTNVGLAKIEKLSKQGDQNVLDVLSYLRSNGSFSKAQMAGIMSNIYAESRFETIAEAKTSKEHAYGLIQWTARYYGGVDKSITYLKQNVGSTINSQMNYLINETSLFTTWYNKTKSNTSPEDCAKLFCQIIEKPADIENRILERAQFALYYYNNFVNK